MAGIEPATSAPLPNVGVLYIPNAAIALNFICSSLLVSIKDLSFVIAALLASFMTIFYLSC